MARFKLELSSLECLRTTEAHGDEVYVIVGAVRSDGTVIREVHPPESHWPMDDHRTADGVRERELHEPLLEIDLEEGQSANAAVIVMERDQGSVQDARQVAEEVAGALKSGHNLNAAMEVIHERFQGRGRNEDDVIGSFSLTARNDGGDAEWDIEPGPQSEILAHWNAESGPGMALRCHQHGDYQVFLHMES